jgi:hypothetical protein
MPYNTAKERVSSPVAPIHPMGPGSPVHDDAAWNDVDRNSACPFGDSEVTVE